MLIGCGRIGYEPMGVAIDSTGIGAVSANGVTSLSLTTLEVGVGANECLIAGLQLSNQSSTEITLRWNGADLTPVASMTTTGAFGTVSVFRLIEPDVGVQTLTADWTGESDAILGAVSFSGADQTECVRAVTADRGSSDTASIAIPSAPGHVTVDVSMTTNAFGAGTQTVRWIAAADGSPRLIQHATHAVLGTSTDSCTLTAPATAGHTLVFIGEGVISSLETVVGAGVTWQRAARATTNSNVEIWYGKTTGSGTTITYTAPAASPMICWVGEFTGLNGSMDAMAASSGDQSPAFPGPLVTTNARDLLVVGYSSFGQPNWGVPTEGPWTSLGEVAHIANSQVAFIQPVFSPGTWNPSIMESASDPRWDAAAVALEMSGPSIGGAMSTAAGTPSNTHAWSTAAGSDWVSVGLDVFP